MKLLAKVLLALLLVLLLLVGALHLWLGSLIKRGVEQVGPRITQTSVALRDADISLLSGRAELEDLTVGNPKGFQTPSAFKLHNATVRLDWKSVLSDTVVIEEILIDGPEITFEGTPVGSNLGTIRDNAKAFAPAESSEKAPAPKRDVQQGSGKKVVIKQFTMTKRAGEPMAAGWRGRDESAGHQSSGHHAQEHRNCVGRGVVSGSGNDRLELHHQLGHSPDHEL